MIKKIGIYIWGLLIIILIAKQFFSAREEENKIIDDVYAVQFSGKVKLISLNRGFNVMLSNETKYFNLNGAQNDTVALSEIITWGDSLSKQAKSAIIILKSKSNGHITRWRLPLGKK